MLLPAFYPILDTETAARHGIALPSAAESILEGGARILQFRHKGFYSRDLFEDLEHVADLSREAGATLVVNDRTDIAALVGASLHLGQDDLPPSEARRLMGAGAETWIGFSTHNERQFRSALEEPVDYLAFGPIFGTSSKANPDPTVGIDELKRLRSLTVLPMVAIGGITRENARRVRDAGADSVAVIGDLFPSDGNLRGRVEEWVHLLSRP